MFAKKRNVGAALAKLLASRGASVVAVDTMKSRLEAVVGSLEGDGHLGLSDYDLLDFASIGGPDRQSAIYPWSTGRRRHNGWWFRHGETLVGIAMRRVGVEAREWPAMSNGSRKPCPFCPKPQLPRLQGQGLMVSFARGYRDRQTTRERP
jgi:hypothetical protein